MQATKAFVPKKHHNDYTNCANVNIKFWLELVASELLGTATKTNHKAKEGSAEKEGKRAAGK